MSKSILDRMFAETLAKKQEHAISDGPLDPIPEYVFKYRPRALILEPNLTPPDRETIRLDDALRRMQQAVLDYLATDNPEHMLLIQLEPGTGKTTSLVEIVELMAHQQKRTFWAMPRHDMYHDLQRAVEIVGGDPRWWYHWQPRKGVPGMDIDPLCRWHEQMEQWLSKGHDSHDFCRNPKICGFDYLNNECPYWLQQHVKHPIICGTHQHLVSGHMLLKTCSIIIGDEYPIGMFAGMLEIPSESFLPNMMPQDQPFTEIVSMIHSLMLSGGHFSGRQLINVLGGAKHIIDACQRFGELDPEDMYEKPNLRDPYAVRTVPHQHILKLWSYLDREASASLAMDTYIERLAVHGGRLVYRVSNKLTEETQGRHIIWLDATGNAEAYRHAFGMPVEVVSFNVQKQGRIIQDWSSLNSRKKMIADKKPTAHTEKLKERLRYIIQSKEYQRPVIITHKPLVDAGIFADLAECAYFGNARGTNKYEGADAVFVVGCPQPSKDAIIDLATAIQFDRMEPYDAEWSDQQTAYDYFDDNGIGRSYPKADFWKDTLLRSLLWQTREAEIFQAIHRGRPIRYPCDVWLFTNLPIPEIQIDAIVQFRDVVGAPQGIDGDRWIKIVEFGYQRLEEQGYIAVRDLEDHFQCNRSVANRYIDGLTEKFPDDFPQRIEKTAGKGRPRKVAGKLI
jgi:hypothetical protein